MNSKTFEDLTLYYYIIYSYVSVRDYLLNTKSQKVIG